MTFIIGRGYGELQILKKKKKKKNGERIELVAVCRPGGRGSDRLFDFFFFFFFFVMKLCIHIDIDKM